MKKRAPLTFDVEKAVSPPVAMPETDLRANGQTEKQENIEMRKRASNQTKGREGRQFIAAHVLPEAARQFKLLAVQKGHTTQSMLIEAINDLFVKYGLSRIADG